MALIVTNPNKIYSNIVFDKMFLWFICITTGIWILFALNVCTLIVIFTNYSLKQTESQPIYFYSSEIDESKAKSSIRDSVFELYFGFCFGLNSNQGLLAIKLQIGPYFQGLYFLMNTFFRKTVVFSRIWKFYINCKVYLKFPNICSSPLLS